MNREPVALPGLITAAVVATLGVAIAFGVNITRDQIAAIVTALGAWLAVLTFFQRAQVTPLADPRDAQGQELVPGPPAHPSEDPDLEP